MCANAHAHAHAVEMAIGVVASAGMLPFSRPVIAASSTSLVTAALTTSSLGGVVMASLEQLAYSCSHAPLGGYTAYEYPIPAI